VEHSTEEMGTMWKLYKIQFIPEKAGYTKETYRIFVNVPKLKKSNSEHAKDIQGNLLYWRDYKDIAITYTVPEFGLVAVNFTSDHGKLRCPNGNNTAPDCYNIGNKATYRDEYGGYTFKCDYKRENGQLIRIASADCTEVINIPITHTWSNTTTDVEVKYSITIKNYGAAIKSKIYHGNTRPTDPDSDTYWQPKENDSKTWPIKTPNNNNKIGYMHFTETHALKDDVKNDTFLSVTINQGVYWTFGTPQVDINEARMNVAVGYVFNGQTKTDTKQILQDMLNKNGMVNFDVNKCIRDTAIGSSESRNWNRLAEGGVDCISHSEFFQKVIKASGLNVSTGVQTYIATYALAAEPKRPETPIEGSFDWIGNPGDPLQKDPAHPQGGARQATNANAFPAIQNKLYQLGQNYNANLIFCRQESPTEKSYENYEAVIILRDTNTNTVFYNPGGTRRIYEEHERKKVITEMMTSLVWQFWEKYNIIEPTTNATITIRNPPLNDHRIVDYNYNTVPIP
jgi:hypothetical protein